MQRQIKKIKIVQKNNAGATTPTQNFFFTIRSFSEQPIFDPKPWVALLWITTLKNDLAEYLTTSCQTC